MVVKLYNFISSSTFHRLRGSKYNQAAECTVQSRRSLCWLPLSLLIFFPIMFYYVAHIQHMNNVQQTTY